MIFDGGSPNGMKPEVEEIELAGTIKQVVDGGYCVGCGACAGVDASPFKMVFTQQGHYLPEAPPESVCAQADAVCPFTGAGEDEDAMGKRAFGDLPGVRHDPYVGYHLANFAGYVKAPDERGRGSSGGLGSWLLKTAMNDGLVSHAVHIRKSKDGNGAVIFEYAVSDSPDGIRAGAKSKYYPVEMSAVIEHIRRVEGSYFLVGVPCFIKAVRLLTREDPTLASRIRFTLGLVCGHLKSDRFAKYVGWQLGIQPQDLTDFDFRVKREKGPASQYDVKASGTRNGEPATGQALVKSLFGTSWGYSFFKLNACDYCDDVLAELADVSIGDAWLPEYVRDPMGTNIMSVRNPTLLDMILRHRDELCLDDLSAKRVYDSQAGGFRQRREGLAYRLELKERKSEWYPRKRVAAGAHHLGGKRKKIYAFRMDITNKSREAYEAAEREDDVKAVERIMSPLLNRYDRLVSREKPLLQRLLRKIRAR